MPSLEMILIALFIAAPSVEEKKMSELTVQENFFLKSTFLIKVEVLLGYIPN